MLLTGILYPHSHLSTRTISAIIMSLPSDLNILNIQLSTGLDYTKFVLLKKISKGRDELRE